MAIIKMKRVFKISLVTVLIMTLVATYSIPTSIAFAGETATTTEESSVDDQAAGTDPGDTEASNDEGGQKGPETTTDSGITTDPETTTDSGISGEGDENSEDSENPGNPEEPNVPVGPGNDGSQNDEDQLGELQDSLNRQMMMAPRVIDIIDIGEGSMTYDGFDKTAAKAEKITFESKTKKYFHSEVVVQAAKGGYVSFTGARYKDTKGNPYFACGTGDLYYTATAEPGYEFKEYTYEVTGLDNGKPEDYVKPEGNKLNVHHARTLLTDVDPFEVHMHHHGCGNSQTLGITVTANFEELPELTYALVTTVQEKTADVKTTPIDKRFKEDEKAVVTITPIKGHKLADGYPKVTGAASCKEVTTDNDAATIQYEVTFGKSDVNFDVNCVPMTYTLTLNCNEGGVINQHESSVNLTELAGEATVSVIATPKEGYKLSDVSYNKDELTVTKLTNQKPIYRITMKNQNATFTAIFAPKKYNITYYANGGEGQMGSQEVTFGTTPNLTKNAFIKNGSYFSGWATSPGIAAVAYGDGSSYTVDAKNIDLYAQWSAIPTFTVTYNKNAGTDIVGNMPETKTYKKNETAYVSAQMPTRAGFTFVGWKTSGDVNITEGTEITSTIELFAQWKALPKVTYHANWDGAAEATTTRSFGLNDTTITLLGSDAFARAGFNLVGWSTTSTGAISGQPEMTYSFSEDTDDIDMYAVWAAIPGTDPEPPAGGNDRPGRGDRTPAQPPAVIEDEGTPLGDAPVVLEEKIIEPEDVPLAELPKTGGMGSMGFLGFGALLAALGIGLKRKEEK